MFSFNGKEYGSKAEVVRELYDQGKLTLAAPDKKRVAEELGMTVQTVHATLVKYLGNTKPAGYVPAKRAKIAPSAGEENTDNRLNQKMARVKSTNRPIFIADKSEEVQIELMKDKRKIPILFAPNQWGMPTSVPPLYVIDNNYDPNWLPPPEEKIEKPW